VSEGGAPSRAGLVEPSEAETRAHSAMPRTRSAWISSCPRCSGVGRDERALLDSDWGPRVLLQEGVLSGTAPRVAHSHRFRGEFRALRRSVSHNVPRPILRLQSADRPAEAFLHQQLLRRSEPNPRRSRERTANGDRPRVRRADHPTMGEMARHHSCDDRRQVVALNRTPPFLGLLVP